MDGSSPDFRARSLNVQAVNWADSSGRCNSSIVEVVYGPGEGLGCGGDGAAADAFAGASAGVAS
jgi:hypothetical protein